MIISKDTQSVVIKKSECKYNYLLIYRFDKDKKEDHYRIIKGRIEDEETSADGALREVSEESGLKNTKIIFHLPDYSYISGDVRHEVSVFVVEAFGDEDINISSAKEGGFIIKKSIWVNPQRAIDLLNFEDEKKLVKLTEKRLV